MSATLTTSREELAEKAAAANSLLRQLHLHHDQHADGFICGPNPISGITEIHSSTLDIINDPGVEKDKSSAASYARLDYHDSTNQDVPNSGYWFKPYISYGLLYRKGPGYMNGPRTQQNLVKLKQIISNHITDTYHLTPNPGMVMTMFNVLMCSSSPRSRYHIAVFNPHLKNFLLQSIPAPLVFAALGTPKLLFNNGYTANRSANFLPEKPRFTAAEAKELADVPLALALEILNVEMFEHR